jgi:hypothetical protein
MIRAALAGFRLWLAVGMSAETGSRRPRISDI